MSEYERLEEYDEAIAGEHEAIKRIYIENDPKFRKRYNRRLYLIGKFIWSLAGKNEKFRQKLMAGLDRFLERDKDRKLFGFKPKQ